MRDRERKDNFPRRGMILVFAGAICITTEVARRSHGFPVLTQIHPRPQSPAFAFPSQFVI